MYTGRRHGGIPGLIVAGLGFITPHRLPLGYGGFVEFPGPDERPRRLQCTLQRCREIAPGWYEAAVCFNREQPELMEVGR